MGLSKSFQLALFIVFGLLIFRIYTVENSEIHSHGETVLANYQQYVTTVDKWNGSGEALYQQMSKDFPFQFFQYIHKIDSDNNFTYGNLEQVKDNLAGQLFHIELGQVHNLPEGRLQIKLDTSPILSARVDNFIQTATLLIITYVSLMLLFMMLMQLHRRRINYAANYINHIPDLSFIALEKSRFPGVLKPVGIALETCRSQLKLSLERVRKENEELTKAAYQDPVSGFSTRLRFTQHMDAISKSNKQKYGVQLLTSERKHY